MAEKAIKTARDAINSPPGVPARPNSTIPAANGSTVPAANGSTVPATSAGQAPQRGADPPRQSRATPAPKESATPAPKESAAPAPKERADLDVAWRVAYVVSGDDVVATTETTAAFAEVAASTEGEPPRIQLLAATVRRTLERAAENRPEGPPVAPGSAVTSALWELPARQRAALWLTEVVGLQDDDLAEVLGLTPDNVEHVAHRAARWLDVALDHKSGPLCQHEPKLADYIDGNLPLVEAAEIDDHLSGCPTCKSKVQAYEELAELPAVLDKAVPQPPTTLGAQAADRGETDTPTSGTERSEDRGPVPPAVRPLAACCAGLLAIGLLGAGVLRTPNAAQPTGAGHERADQQHLAAAAGLVHQRGGCGGSGFARGDATVDHIDHGHDGHVPDLAARGDQDHHPPLMNFGGPA